MSLRVDYLLALYHALDKRTKQKIITLLTKPIQFYIIEWKLVICYRSWQESQIFSSSFNLNQIYLFNLHDVNRNSPKCECKKLNFTSARSSLIDHWLMKKFRVEQGRRFCVYYGRNNKNYQHVSHELEQKENKSKLGL